MTHHQDRKTFPFTAIVGQEKLKKALILNAVNPDLNGVLIRGERGTAKSTAVRALAELLPEVEVVKDCPFNCDPNDPSLQCEVCNEKYENGEELPAVERKMRVVDLPLGATEDRVIGTLDLERALDEGIKALEPGILAEVNQGILYIDEVNLLDDHLVDTLLDSAAMNVNVIERENLSLSHPSKFILVGTMNPEEGELRPQLLDRFGLQVDVEGIQDVDKRVEIVNRVEKYKNSREEFLEEWRDEQKNLRNRIKKAREILDEVEINKSLLGEIAEICMEFNVDGHRADILIARTAKTIAAYQNRKKVNINDIEEAAKLVLPHRLRREPFEEPEPLEERIEDHLQNEQSGDEKEEEREEESGEREEENNEPRSQDGNEGDEEESSRSSEERENSSGRKESTFGIRETDKADIERQKDNKERVGSGKRARTLARKRGRYVKSKHPQGKTDDVALDATFRASLARNGNLEIGEEDIREKVREKRKSSTIAFVVDASGSMAAKKRMEVAKGAVLSLLEDSYQKRDKVAFIAFKGERAEVLLPPTSSVKLAARKLKELPTGRKTPLPDGMIKGLEVLERELRRDENAIPIMVLVSDGRGNVPINENVRMEVLSIAERIREKGVHLVVIDTETGLAKIGYNREIAETANGQYTRIEDLSPESVTREVKPLIGGDGL